MGAHIFPLFVLLSFSVVLYRDDGELDDIEDPTCGYTADMHHPANTMPRWDPHGYIAFSPCYGRFGNQVERVLHAMLLAQQTGRTLIMPDFCDSSSGLRRFIPFEQIFDSSGMQAGFPLTVSWPQFLDTFGDTRWPLSNRFLFCYQRVKGPCYNEGQMPASYFEGIGVPLNRTHNVRFMNLTQDPDRFRLARTLRIRGSQISRLEYPVVVLANGIAYPAPFEALPLQRFLQWAPSLLHRASALMRQLMLWPENSDTIPAYVAVHLRVAKDFEKFCKRSKAMITALTKGMWRPQFDRAFEARMCFDGGRLQPSAAACFPTREAVQDALQMALDRTGACYVYIGSDSSEERVSDFLDISQLRCTVSGQRVKLLRQPLPKIVAKISPHRKIMALSPQLDLAVMSQATHFVGSCFSSFTAVVTRMRKYARGNMGFSYFGVRVRNTTAAA